MHDRLLVAVDRVETRGRVADAAQEIAALSEPGLSGCPDRGYAGQLRRSLK